MSIWAHTLVRNEERYVWYAVMSVIDYVDKILLWDTGSRDATVDIVKELKLRFPKKIEFKQVGEVNIDKFTEVRQEMLQATKAEWFIIVDGDEVWWDNSISEIAKLITKKGDRLDSVVVRYKNIVGDIYHYQEEAAGKYKIDGEVGHVTIRAMNTRIPGLHFSKPHGTQGIFDESDVLIQEMDRGKRVHLTGDSYLHFTHMPRSSSRQLDVSVPKRGFKLKYEVGQELPLDYYYPEAFFLPRPDFIPSPWERMPFEYHLKSTLPTLLRRFKRRYIKSSKQGY